MREPAFRVIAGSGDDDVVTIEQRGGANHSHAHGAECFRVKLLSRRFAGDYGICAASVRDDLEGVVGVMNEVIVFHNVTSSEMSD